MATSRFKQDELPIGTTNGCLTIIGGFEEYEQLKEEEAAKKIAEYQRQIEEYKTTGEIAPLPTKGKNVLLSVSGFAMYDDPIPELENAIDRAKNWRTDRNYRPQYKEKM